MTCQCARVVHLVSIVARYARRETDDECATRSRVGVNRVKLPRARAIAKEAEATDSETQLGRRLAGGEVFAVPDGRRGFLGA